MPRELHYHLQKADNTATSPTFLPRRTMENSSEKDFFITIARKTLRSSPAGLVEFLLFLNILLSISAFLSNVLILFSLRQVSSIHPPTKLFFRCLAVTDFCVGLIVQPLYVYVTYTAFRVKDIRGDVLYRVYNICGIISTILSAVSVLTSTAISVDRLLVLMLEMRYRHVVTLGRVRGVVIGFWLLGASTLPVWLWSRENFYRGSSLIVLLCLITSTSCYVKIHLTLWKHHAQINVQNHFLEQPNERGGSPLNIARYKKTLSSISWVQVALLVCYIPYSIVAGSGNTNQVIWSATASLVFLNSSLNPILYCWKIREVRHAVKDTISHINCF